MTGPGIITYTDPNGPQVGFYQMRIIFWMITIDDWQNSDTVTVKINSNSSFVKTMREDQRQT
jgi:hypothetical protein